MTLTQRLVSSASRAAQMAVQGAVGLAAGVAIFLAVSGAPLEALAQAAPAQAPAAAPAVKGQGPALWVVKDEDSTLYLFGTVHVLRPSIGWSSPRVEAAFNSADQIWFEISNPDDQAAMMPLIQQYGLSPQTPLSSLLTEEEFASLDTAAKTMGLSAAALDPMRPWLAGLTLSVAPLVKAGFDPASGVDIVLKARAEAAGKPIHAFETIDQQVRMLATLPEPVQLAFVRQGIEDYDRAVEMLDGLVEAWSIGDVDQIDALMIEEMKAEHPDLHKVLLVDRNTDWANQIQTMLEGSGTAFIAVGAAHLAGEDSVQSMLKTRGVSVQAVE